jgi:PAS domain S-box-containing protein
MTPLDRTHAPRICEVKPPAPRGRLRMKKAAPTRCDVGAAVTRLAGELVIAPSSRTRSAALDQLRRRLHASDALLWLCSGIQASCVLHESGGQSGESSKMVELEDGAAAIRRLRFTGSILCRVGDVSGLECLVPPATRSYAAAAVTSGEDTTAVLIVGWRKTSPPCTYVDSSYLRIAVALLANGIEDFTGGANGRHELSDAILATLSERIAVVERNGTIIAVNAAWTKLGALQGATAPAVIGPGANYFDVCRRAIASGCDQAAAALEGINAVCNGSADSFTTAYRGGVAGEDGWVLMNVKPLAWPEGGAVIVHTQITDAEMMHVARGIGTAEFHQLLNSVPVPIWIISPDGRLIYANEQWLDATRHHGVGPGNGNWTAAFHPSDRDAASSAVRDAATRGAPFEIEARLGTADGSYRWSACRAVPQYAADGSVASYVGACWDTSARRRMESSLRQLAAKLVAVQESERARVARELHDDIGQQLAVLSLRLEALAREPGRAAMQRGVAEACTALQEIAAAVHALSHQLHPAKLRLLGLLQTLQTLCRDLSAKAGIRIRWHTQGVPQNVGEELGLCVFRVAQEALRNAMKHSGATVIDVSLTATPSVMTLRISDNGAGFDPLTSPTAGIGLQTMRERVDLVGGVLAVEALRPHGTTVRVDLPLRSEPASNADETSGELVPAAPA